jgi:hypothetical protein
MKKHIAPISLLIIAGTTILLAACALNPSQNTGGGQQNTQLQTDTRQQSQQLIGGQKDAGGCLTGAGYRWCGALNKCVRPWEEFCANLVPETLTALKTATGIKFSDPADGDLQWKVRKANSISTLNLKGKFIASTNLKKDDYDKIGASMLTDGFAPDLYNTASGTGTGTDGYKQTTVGLVCLINYTSIKSTQGLTPDQILKLNRNVNVACGMLSKE